MGPRMHMLHPCHMHVFPLVHGPRRHASRSLCVLVQLFFNPYTRTSFQHPVGPHASWCTSPCEGGFATFGENGGPDDGDDGRANLRSCGDINPGALRRIKEDGEGKLSLKAGDQASSSAASSRSASPCKDPPRMTESRSDKFHERPSDGAVGGLRGPDGSSWQGGRAVSRMDPLRASLSCMCAPSGGDSLYCDSTASAPSDDGTMTSNVGTLQWMSPELMSGDTNYSVKVDVYAYGMLLYEARWAPPGLPSSWAAACSGRRWAWGPPRGR
ncbi:unnamed protein product, partial [Prorocentrum cordatum]